MYYGLYFHNYHCSASVKAFNIKASDIIPLRFWNVNKFCTKYTLQYIIVLWFGCTFYISCEIRVYGDNSVQLCACLITEALTVRGNYLAHVTFSRVRRDYEALLMTK